MKLRIENTVKGDGYTIESLEGEILLLSIDGTNRIDIEEVHEIKKTAFHLTKNKPFRNVVDFQNSIGIVTKKAQKLISSDEDFTRLKICDALITQSTTSLFLIDTYLRVFNPKTPTKVFSNMEDAFEWVESM